MDSNKGYESFHLLDKWRTNVKPELIQQDYDKLIFDRIRLWLGGLLIKPERSYNEEITKVNLKWGHPTKILLFIF